MSAVQSRNIAKLQTKYAVQQESMELSSARKRKLLYRRLTVFFILAGLISFFMIKTYFSQMAELHAKEVEKNHVEKQLSELKKKKQILEEEIVKLNDDDYIAKLARKEYFLSQDNEIIFNIPGEDNQKSSQ